MTVCVVGAGIAGAACARVLADAGVPVEVRDRGRSPGGRMSSRTLWGRPVDLGASYFTARDPAFAAQVDDWLARGVARPWTDAFAVLPGGERKAGPVRYAAAGGLRAVVVDLCDGLGVRSGTEVEHVSAGEVDGTGYEAVVLAMPDPQALRLLDASLVQERSALAAREWQPVLAVAARYPSRRWDVEGAFVHDDDVLDWIADDGARRGDGAPVLVAHTTPAFAAAHLQDPAAAAPDVTAALSRLLAVGAPDDVHVQRWTFAKPVGTREAPFHLGDAQVGLCGDGWGASKVEAAWLSGTGLGQALVARLARERTPTGARGPAAAGAPDRAGC